MVPCANASAARSGRRSRVAAADLADAPGGPVSAGISGGACHGSKTSSPWPPRPTSPPRSRCSRSAVIGLDAAILFSDILMVPWALGQGLAFREGEGPVLPPLRDAAGVAGAGSRRTAGPAGASILETVRQVRHMLKTEGLGDTSLIGFAGAPFTVACYMVEGGGSRDFARHSPHGIQRPGLVLAPAGYGRAMRPSPTSRRRSSPAPRP